MDFRGPKDQLCKDMGEKKSAPNSNPILSLMSVKLDEYQFVEAVDSNRGRLIIGWRLWVPNLFTVFTDGDKMSTRELFKGYFYP